MVNSIVNGIANGIVNGIDNGIDYGAAKSPVDNIPNDLANTSDKDLVNSIVKVYPLKNHLYSQWHI